MLVQEWWYCRTTRPKGEILLLWQHNYPLNSIVNYMYMYLSGSFRWKKRQIVLRHRTDISFCLASGLLFPLSNKDCMAQIDDLAKPKLLMYLKWEPISLRSNFGALKVHNSLTPFIKSKNIYWGSAICKLLWEDQAIEWRESRRQSLLSESFILVGVREKVISE